MNNRALLVLAVLCSACIPQTFALSPTDAAEAVRILDRVTRIANETQILTPGAELEAPTPRDDTKGKFLSPYRSDGELTDWANKAINATAGAAVAGVAADKATDTAVNKLASKVPGGALVGGLLKKKTKDKAQELGAVTAVGGWDYIRKTSDISFDSAEELAVYMHATHSGADANFAKAVGAAFSVYPVLKDAYEPAVRNAYAAAAARGPKIVPPAPEFVAQAAPAVPAETAEVVVPVAVATATTVEAVQAQAVPVRAAVVVPAAPAAPAVVEASVVSPAEPAPVVTVTPVARVPAAPVVSVPAAPVVPAAPAVPAVAAFALDAKEDFDWKSRALTRTNRVAVTGFRVALVVQDKVPSSVAAGYQFGGTSGARGATEVELHGIDASLLQEMADTLYAEFLEGLAASGREVVPIDQAKASSGWAQIEPAPVDASGVYRHKPGMGQSRHLAVASPSGLPLWFENASQIGDKGVFDQANVKAMNAVSVDLNAVVVAPTFLITFADLESSGKKGDAKAPVKPGMSILEDGTLLWTQHAKVKFTGETYKGSLNDNVLVGEYGGDMQPFAGASGAGFFAAAGPTRATQTLVVTVDREEFRARALVALRAVNAAFLQIVRENKP